MNRFKVINKENAAHTLVELKNLDTVSDLSKFFKRRSNPTKIAPDVNSSSQQSVTKTSTVWLTRTLSTDCIRHQEDFWTTAQIEQLLMLKHGRETSHKYYHTRNRQHATCPAQLNTKYDALIVLALTSFYDLFLLFRLHTESLPQRQRMYREDLTVLRPASS